MFIFMKAGVLFSGGKDSCYSAYLAKKAGYELACLITIFSENKESYMFHTPSIEKTKQQAEVMNIPLLIQKTKGEKEKELEDLEQVIKLAKEKYGVDAIVSGAIASNYQRERIENICKKLSLKSITPLWHKDEVEYLKELVDCGFKVIITGVFAYPLDNSWLGRIIDDKFIEEVKQLKEKYKIHPAGEGGETESFVLDCSLFKQELKVKSFKDISTGENSWRREIELE